MRFFYLAFSLHITFGLRAQDDLFYKGSQISYAKVDNEFIAISQRPVTNREYIIYLMWLRNTFVSDNRDYFYNSVPGLNVDSLKQYIASSYKKKMMSYYFVDMNTVINYSYPFVKNYMFNPKYLDYPVVGVSWQNANNYGKWLSDRYNEVTLVKKGHLEHCPFPTDQDYFNTEDYVAGMWQGQLKQKLPSTDTEISNVKTYNWNDHVFIPAFRLPSKEEISEVKKTNIAICEVKPYLFSKKHFLNKWKKQFFKNENDTSFVLTECSFYKDYGGDTIILNKTFPLQIKGEMSLDIHNSIKSKTIAEIYLENGQVKCNLEQFKEIRENQHYPKYLNKPIKNEHYFILDEDNKNNPIFISEYEDLLPPDYINFKCFRLACSMGKKQYAKIIEK